MGAGMILRNTLSETESWQGRRGVVIRVFSCPELWLLLLGAQPCLPLRTSCGHNCEIRLVKKSGLCCRSASSVRMTQPPLGRLYGQLEGHLMDELFDLRDTKFLRRWSCRFPHVTGGAVVLRLADWSSVWA